MKEALCAPCAFGEARQALGGLRTASMTRNTNVLLLWAGVAGALATEASAQEGRVPIEYTRQTCEAHWRETAREILRRAGFDEGATYSAKEFGAARKEMRGFHKALELSVRNGRLYCSVNQEFVAKGNNGKWYRMYYYVRRLVELIAISKGREPGLPDIDFIAHVSDQPRIWGSGKPRPVMGVSGTHFTRDLAAVPFTSFVDMGGIKEHAALREIAEGADFRDRWLKRKHGAFFCGSPSDCYTDSMPKGADPKAQCPRIKAVSDAHAEGAPKALEGVKICYGQFTNPSELMKKYGLNRKSLEPFHAPSEHARLIATYRYLVNLDGAGPWSRRLSVLLGAGGAVLNHVSYGWQFYDAGMKEGVHLYRFFTAPHMATLREVANFCKDGCSAAIERVREEEQAALSLNELVEKLEAMEEEVDAKGLRAPDPVPFDDDFSSTVSSLITVKELREDKFIPKPKPSAKARRGLLWANATARRHLLNDPSTWMPPRFVARTSENFVSRCMRHAYINKFVGIFLEELAKHQTDEKLKMGDGPGAARMGKPVDITQTGISKSGEPCNGRPLAHRDERNLINDLKRYGRTRGRGERHLNRRKRNGA